LTIQLKLTHYLLIRSALVVRNISAGMDQNPVKAGIGGLIMFSLVVAWAYWINRLRPTKA
jgi:hypothetical protein